MASTKKQRGARKAPRSSFRAKPPSKTKQKPTAKPKTAAAKKATRRTKEASSRAPFERATQIRERATQTLLGEIRVPSGRLAIFDVGLVGYLPREALEPAIVKAEVPRDRPLSVFGTPIGKGRFADCWDHVSVELLPGEVYTSKKLGEAGVDFARLVLMDHAALDHWQHEDSLDGKADLVFWGRDEAQLARAMNARKTGEGLSGWVDLSLAEAEAKGDQAARLKSDHGWAFAVDHRPHSHHYYALAAARRSPHGAGTLELAGTQLLLFFTSWGDGVFPIYLDLDHDERPVRVRIQLARPESKGMP